MTDPSPPTPVPTATLRHPAVVAWLRMLRLVSRTERASAARFRPLGVSNAQFDVLAQVGAAGGMMQQELAERLLSTQGNVCQLVSGLEQRGLIQRRREGRTKRLFLTAEGKHLYRKLVPEHEAWLPGQFAALTRAEQEELSRLLRKLERSHRPQGVATAGSHR